MWLGMLLDFGGESVAPDVFSIWGGGFFFIIIFQ